MEPSNAKRQPAASQRSLSWLARAVSWIKRRIDLSGDGALRRPLSSDEIAPRYPSDLILGATAIYYRYSSALGVELHPNDTARRCLEAGVAIAAVDIWGNVLVDTQLAADLQGLKSLERRAAAASTGGKWALTLFILRHPVRSIRVMRAGGSDEADTADLGSPSAIVDNTIGAVRQQLVDVAILEGLASGVDQDVVRPHYLVTEPWIRLTLPPVTISRIGDDQSRTLDVNALVHRCGEAIITFGDLLDPPAGSAGLSFVNSTASSSRHDIVESTLDAKLLEHYGKAMRQPLGGTPQPDDERRSTIKFAHERAPACLDDIFHVYREALCEALTGRAVDAASGEYLMLPFISLRTLDAGWHAQVGQLLAMHIRTDELAISEVRNSDPYAAPVTETYLGRVWASPACVVQIASASFRERSLEPGDGEVPGAAWLQAEASTGLAVDLALLRIGLTSRLSQRLTLASASEIEAVSRSTLAHYELLSAERVLRVGELAAVEEKVLALHDFTRRREALLRQRELAQGVAAADEAKESQRIARRIEVTVAVLTIAVALPGAIGVLLQIGTWNDRFPLGGRPFKDWAPIVVAMPIGLVAIAALVALISAVTRAGGRRRRARQAKPLGPLPRAPRRGASPFPLGGLRFIPADQSDGRDVE